MPELKKSNFGHLKNTVGLKKEKLLLGMELVVLIIKIPRFHQTLASADHLAITRLQNQLKH